MVGAGRAAADADDVGVADPIGPADPHGDVLSVGQRPGKRGGEGPSRAAPVLLWGEGHMGPPELGAVLEPQIHELEGVGEGRGVAHALLLLVGHVEHQELLAVAHRRQLQIRDDQIAKLNYDISAAQSNIQKMDVALRILRRECGKPDDWMPAGILLEEDGLRSSREKWRHKTHELEEQNEELEAQRLRLLQKLRQQSEMSAGQGTRFFGLTPDQCDIVFQYIEELRDGGTDMPLNDKSRELQHKVNQLEAEIGKLRKHGIKTATELAAGGTVHYHEAAPQSPHSMQPMMTGAIDPSFSEGLQASLMRLFDENSKLRRDLARITQDLPHLVSELHQRQASDGESKKEDKVEQEKYEELLEERDHLQQELQSALQQVRPRITVNAACCQPNSTALHLFGVGPARVHFIVVVLGVRFCPC